ncbi:DUF305 domain-containing protein [Arcticibacter eurypsychrophilus]|uniref:DUF305 domain-containing protein n=1 Tax=Arcticibacter eurypsychrophilus TaxID=1434752 RepID=UPI00084D3823|nr:DUF305 domain-containing protein [Arcticibacter eurypsychrophilus]
MKITHFLILSTTLSISMTSCSNPSTKQNDVHSEMNHDSMSSNVMDTSSSHGSGTSGAMNKMMSDMHQIQMTGNVDVDFAMMMKAHHQGAVDMAKEELRSGTADQVKSMAGKIVDAQEKEIDELNNFIESHKRPQKDYDPMNKEVGFGKVMNRNMTMMMDMPKAEDGSTDQQFARMMLPHHRSAVFMAEGFVQSGKDPKLLAMSKKMIADQKAEIKELQDWLSSIGPNPNR